MKSFKFINNVAGWVTFAIAALVYLLTIEPTASLWDCGEFIATSYKMEVGHAPGNSMFMLIARFFTLFTSSPAHVAMLVNAMSALCSAFCILFLFWSITHLARRVYTKNGEELSLNKIIAVIGAGFVGALAYTFSDTFWFSAVEGEVYAMSSLFTALVVWAILKWEEEADQKYANRWLILLAYLMGISVGVHLLNLLALPAIVFVYYFKKHEQITRKGIIYTLLIAGTIIAVTVFAIIPGLPQIGKVFELIFVNHLGLPFNSGLAFYAFFIIALLTLGIYYTYTPSKKMAYAILVLFSILMLTLIYALIESILPVISTLVFIAVCLLALRFANKFRTLMNTMLLCLTVFILGYFSLATIVIRSEANPPINENAPDNAISLLRYINREQYGDRPLFSGESFASPVLYDESTGEPSINYTTFYFKDKLNGKDVYNSIQMFDGYNFNSSYKMFLPRLFSQQADHIEEYVTWTGMKIPRTEDGSFDKQAAWKGPKMSENIKFMFNYQFNWMYWRFFMWNYAGRQNDIQGHGGSIRGNWITGIPAIDDMRLGIKTADLPDYLKENKGYNRYFLLPLILGLFGLVFQFVNDKRNFVVIFLLFIMTGIAVAFYLNMPPLQPRERDYVFAGSTYAFAIWIGFGVLSVYQFFSTYIRKKNVAAIAATTVCMVVPIIMVAQNWDDHDRSDRYTARDLAYNYLMSCGKNTILVTFGDNDTFPLWYLQETEEVRTDVRVMNTSLLGGDWYIDQMKWRVYDSDPVPFSLPAEQYRTGTNERLYIVERTKSPLTAKQIISFISNPKNRLQGETYVPTRTIAIPVDKKAALENGIVAAKDSELMVDTVYLKLSGGKTSMIKAEMMVIDLFANYKWDRPICFSSGSTGDIELGLQDYLQFDGFVYKFVPLYTPRKGFDVGRIDADVLYDNLMNKYRWGNMNAPDVLIDYHNVVAISLALNVREHFARLADVLLNNGRVEEAVAVLDRCMELMPRNPFFYNISNPQHEMAIMDIISYYYRANEIDKANKLFDDFVDETTKCLRFFVNMKGYSEGVREIELNMMYLNEMKKVALIYSEKERAERINNTMSAYIQMFKVQQSVN